MAVYEGEQFRREDFLVQVNVVAEEIKAIGAQDILELGTGKGFNLSHLTQNFPDRQFSGIDLSPSMLLNPSINYKDRKTHRLFEQISIIYLHNMVKQIQIWSSSFEYRNLQISKTI